MGDGMLEIALLVASLPALVAMAVWAARRPVRLLGAYFAVLPFGSAFSLPLGVPRSFSTLSSLLGIVVGAAYLWRALAKPRDISVPSVGVPVWILFAALASASVAWSIRPAATFDDIQVLVPLVALFAVVVVSPIDRSDLRQLQAWIVGGAAATGLYALALALTGALPTTGAGVPRFEITGAGGGEGGDPNITAAALVVPIAIALAEAFDIRSRALVRAYFAASAVLAGTAVLLTASRGGVLAVAIVSLVTLITHRRRVLSLLLMGVAVLPAVLLIPFTLAERVGNTGTTGRTAIWKLAIESCPQYCVTGSGFGTFPDVHESAFLTTNAATGQQLRYEAHSIWFESLIELGIIGLALLLVALGMLGRDLFRLRSSDRGGALAGLVGLLVANSFLSNLAFKYFWLGVTYAVLVVAANTRSTTAVEEGQSLSVT